jgi:lipid-binding SYLF domain-containing protein
MQAFYGPHVSSRSVLKGEVESPAAAHSFLDAVRDAKAQAVASK